MQVQQFLDAIEANHELPLLFDYGNGKIVQGGYHVTEIKNATFDTIDCGNSLHRWKEVIVQVWVPEEASEDEPFMPASKFMKIWDVVDSRLSLFRDAEIRIEFGDASNLTSNYHVDGFVATEDGLVVQMAPPRTMCKPREILIPFTDGQTVNVGQIAGAVQRVEEVIPLSLDLQSNSVSCCSPAESGDSNSSCCG
ncbi:MAG: DUF6428 family protein [Chloroflexota bacterium]